MLSAVELFLALQMGVTLGVVIVLALAAGLLIPFLLKEIRRGKVQLGPRTPVGAGDNHPGKRGDPAPGQPDAQADPYDTIASR